MRVTGTARFERLFRTAAGLDVDKSDLARFDEFVNHTIRNLLVRGEAVAKANGRDILEPHDLPITKGLQECIHEFRRVDATLALEPMLDAITTRPPIDLAYSEETEARLPEIAGGIAIALARLFKIIDPDMKNPQSLHWERAYHLFQVLL